MTSAPGSAPPGAPPAPPASAVPPPPAGVARVGGGVWTEHVAPDGRRKYWHNAVTRQSTYEKPPELMTPTERADATTRWKEATAADGRAYYHHLDTKETRWTLPDELRVAREAALAAEGAAAARAAVAKAAAAGAAAGAAAERKDASESKSSPAETTTTSYATKADAELAFRAALADADVSATATWQDASRAIAHDPRRDALKTAGEKRRCLNEYQARRAKEDRAARRSAEKRARDAFSEMLRERAAAGTLGGIRTDDDDDPEQRRGRAFPRLRDVEDAIRTDARFIAVRDAATREDLIRAFLEDDARRRRDERRASRRAAADAYRELLLERGVNAKSRWRETRDACADDPRAAACDAEDRLETFASLSRRLGDEEIAADARARDERRRVERLNREAFVALLDAKRRDGSMPLRLPWRLFVETQLADEPAYERAATNGSGSRPRELYEDAQEEMERDAEADRLAVEAAARDIGFVIDENTDAKALRAALDAASPDGVFGDDRLPEKNDATAASAGVVVVVVAGRRTETACGDAVATAKTAARRAARRKRRALEDFERLLASSRRVSRSKTTWEDAERRLGDEPEWRRCCGGGRDEDGRRVEGEYLEDAKALFAARAVRLAAREAEARAAMEEGEALPDEDEDEGGAGSEGERRRRRRRREDSRSRSRSRSPSPSRSGGDDDDEDERKRRRKRSRRSRSR